MKRDDILRMAREVGAVSEVIAMGRHSGILFTPHELEHFAALVVAAEREACARIAESAGYRSNGTPAYEHIAEAIRARSST